MTDPIQKVKDNNGELVLDYDSRFGARPYARYVDGEWDIMSLSYVPTRQYGQDDPNTDHGVNTTVHTVDLEPENISESKLRDMAKHPRDPTADPDKYLGVSVIPVEESPFPHRDEIPAKEEIVSEETCNHCGESFRQYHPGPFTECPHCQEPIATDGETNG